MAKRDANAYLVTVTVTISVVLFLSGYVPILMDPSKEKDNELPGFVLPTLDDDFWPADPPPQESLVIPPGDAISIKPIQEGLSGEISIPSESSEVKDLDFLEGLSKFSNKRPWGPGCGTGLGPTYYSPENIALSISQQTMATKPEGEFEKGVSICFEEDILYLLDKDRGLVVVDISNPYVPKVLTYVQLFGDPLEMIVHDGYGYILVETFLPIWHDSLKLVWNHSWGTPTYRIGSRLLVVNLTEPENARIEHTYGLEGFASAMFHIGERLYTLSNCYYWYLFDWDGPKHRGDRQERTNMMCLKMQGGQGVEPLDTIYTDSTSIVASVGAKQILVGRTLGYNPWGSPLTFTVMSLGLVNGSMSILGTDSTEGEFNSAGWLQWHGDYLWVFARQSGYVYSTNVNGSEGFERVTVCNVKHGLDHAIFDDDHAYIIDTVSKESRVFVFGLSDPMNPEYLSTVTIPDCAEGIKLMEGGILLTGTTQYRSNTYFSIWFFPITVADDGNATVMPMVKIERSAEVPDQKVNLWRRPSITSHLVEGRIITFVSYIWNVWIEGGSSSRNSVSQLVAWDPSGNDISLLGEINSRNIITPFQPNAFLRYWCIETPGESIRFIDLRDLKAPRYSVEVVFQPTILDAMCLGNACVQIVKVYYPDGSANFRLWINPIDDMHNGSPDIQMYLGFDVIEWKWNGAYLHVLEGYYRDTKNMNISLFTVNLTDPLNPLMGPRWNETILLEPGHYKRTYDYLDHWWRPIKFLYRDYVNPDLVEGEGIALINGGAVYLIDISDPMVPTIINRLPCEYGRPTDIRAVNGMLLIANEDYQLIRLNLRDPKNPRILNILSIPGDPVGVSADGLLYYTVAYWDLTEVKLGVDFKGYSFNAVNINSHMANIEWAISVPSDNAIILNETLFVFPEWPRWWSQGQYYYGITNDTNTTIYTYDIAGRDAPHRLAEIEVKGDISLFAQSGGVLLIGEVSRSYCHQGLIAIDARDPDSMTILGHFDVEWLGSTRFHLKGGMLLISQDNRGLALLRIE